MEIKINIPNNFTDDYIGDKFKDFFSRVMVDITGYGACGIYEKEIAEMFLKAFAKAQKSITPATANTTTIQEITSLVAGVTVEWPMLTELEICQMKSWQNFS